MMNLREQPEPGGGGGRRRLAGRAGSGDGGHDRQLHHLLAPVWPAAKRAGDLYGAIQSAVAGAERVFAMIDETAEDDAPDARC